MVLLNTIDINPPLLNSSCAWSSDLAQLSALYESPYTGAITTRTATSRGYSEDPSVHTVVFADATTSTLNSYGYSPHPLATYLSWVEQILTAHPTSTKPIIISITSSSPATLAEMVSSIQALRVKLGDTTSSSSSSSSSSSNLPHNPTLPQTPSRIAIELNTSCPNIPNSPPSGYTFASLLPLLNVLADAHKQDASLTIGLKLPPYTYLGQFEDVVAGLRSLATVPTLTTMDVSSEPTISGAGASKDVPTVAPTTNLSAHKSRQPIAFLTCTNTLGNSLFFAGQAAAAAGSSDANANNAFALPTPLGGLAGDAIHALALGNVHTFKQLLAGEEGGLGGIKIIGVGGVTSKEAAARMRTAGADAVASATFFGKEGVRAFEILSE